MEIFCKGGTLVGTAIPMKPKLIHEACVLTFVPIDLAADAVARIFFSPNLILHQWMLRTGSINTMKNLKPVAKLLRVAVLSAFVLAAPSLVRAGTIVTPPSTVLLTPTDWPTGETLSFPQFDPSLGTLTSVTLDLSGSLNTTITATNVDGSNTSSGTANAQVQFSVQDLGSNLTVPQLTLTSPGFTYSLLPGQSISSGPLTQSGTSSNTYTNPAVLDEFTGLPGNLGTNSLSASTYTLALIAVHGGNTYPSQVTAASLTGTVTYTYTAVPEPSAFALLGAGVAALSAFAWRRRTKFLLPVLQKL
jgi:hypothetical protein